MADRVKITVYRWAGQKWFLRIRSECVECDLAVAQVHSLLDAHPDWPVSFETKPWLSHLGESLRHGGWHAPVTLVDGRVVRQGKVPTSAELEATVRQALARRGFRWDCPSEERRRDHTAHEPLSALPTKSNEPNQELSMKLRACRSDFGVTFWLLLVAGLVGATNLLAQRRPMEEEKIGDGTLVTVLPKDAIPALTNPVFLSRAEAEPLMEDGEPVLGLVDPVSGQAKAYSLWLLDRHEIVNDRLGGKPVAVTW